MEHFDRVPTLRRLALGAGLALVLTAGGLPAQAASCTTAAECSDGDACTADACTLTDTPAPAPNCTGKVTALTFRYTGLGCSATTNTQSGKATCTGGAAGRSPVRIVLRYNDSTIYGDTAGVPLGGTTSGTAAAAGKSEFSSTTRVQILDAAGTVLEALEIHTSCSKPLDLGDHFGSLELVGLTTTEGGQQGLDHHCTHTPVPDCTRCFSAADCNDQNACTVDTCVPGTPPPAPHCTGKVTALTFRYTGLGCSATTNTQSGKATCTGGTAGRSPVRIVLRYNDSTIYGDTAGVPLDGTASATAAAAGKTEFSSTTRVHILDAAGTVLEALEIHTSCSKPLDLGDRFGSLELVGLTTTEGGPYDAHGLCARRAVTCDDQNACTEDGCDAASGCGHTPITGCEPCTTAADCPVPDACSPASCLEGICLWAIREGCTPCADAADCGDGNGCTVDTCEAGVCAHRPEAGCVPCATAAACADGDGCTDDVCTAAGVCAHVPVSGCTPCATPADCDDRNPCTTETCTAGGSCEITVLPGCVRCDDPNPTGLLTPLGCADGDPCTEDTCTGGVCTFTRLEDCAVCEPTVEHCGDGRDNDCDELIDCADPNCVAAPACPPPAEICGDCADNDGDGLVDYEDVDCCGQQMTLRLQRLRIRPNPRTKRQDRLRLKALYSKTIPAGFDPMTADTTLQIADAHGQLFCATIDAHHWMPKGRRHITFWDTEGTFAHGLADGRFTLKRNGRIRFLANGRGMPMHSAAGDVRITVRVGDLCSTTTAAPRSLRSGNVFP